MMETVAIQREKFFRPKVKREEKGVEKFQAILKKTIRMALLLLSISFFLFMAHRIYMHLLEDQFFRVKQIDVEGNRRIPKEIILSLARTGEMLNLFTVKLAEVGRRLESHPWIKQVKVRKIFPNKMLIQVEERKPIAILQLEALYYIDTQGVVFSPVGEKDGYNYPFLTGLTRRSLERDPVEAKHLITKALELLRIVEKEKSSPLEEISEIHMERTYGIGCFMQAEGVEVRMGWEHFGEKLKRLPLIWTDLRNRGISAASIDCSDMKRVVVKAIPKVKR
jgi:cell division protein FtsQ